MKTYPRLLFLFAIIVLESPSLWASDLSVQMIEQTKNSLTLELITPPYHLSKHRSSLTIEGFHPYLSKQGFVLPSKGRLIGIPKGAKLSLDILSHEFATLPNIVLARTGEVLQSVPPTAIVSIGFSGMMRDQPMAQILFHPAQYDPKTSVLTIYTHLRVKVTFIAPARPLVTPSRQGIKIPSKVKNSPFERMMQKQLINYSSLGR